MSSVRVVVHETIGSTNADALERARGGERGPLWIVARRQTAGRGRRGRTWVSEPGNLHATLLLTDPAPPERAAELSFVAALAVHDAICRLAPDLAPRFTLKWPNDGLIDGAKFAGILIEGEGSAVATGIGVNCRHHPADTAFPATDLAAAGADLTADEVFEALSQAMIGRVVQWNRGRDFAAIRKDWLDRAYLLHQTVRIAGTDGEVTGRFETIDETGRLVLRQSDGGLQSVAAGDVSPAPAERRAAAAGH